MLRKSNGLTSLGFGLLWCLVVMLGASTLVGVYHQQSMKQADQVMHAAADQTLTNISTIVPYLVDYYELVMLTQLEKSHEYSPAIRYLFVVDSAGEPILGHRSSEELAAFQAGSGIHEYRKSIALDSGDPASITVGMELDYFHHEFKALARILILVVLLGSLAAGVLGWWIKRANLDRAKRADDLQQEREAKELAETSARMKSEFLANMSHEIRTPLNGIVGIIELMGRTDLDVQQRDFLKDLDISTRNLVQLLNQVLDASRIEAGKLTLDIRGFELPALLENLGSIFGSKAQQKNLDLVIDVAEEVPVHFRGDPLRLQQILNNLVGNALKFTEAGEVRVEVSIALLTEVQATLVFEVKDSGPGIPEDSLSTLFDPFTQAESTPSRRFQGVGLGLSISREIVRLMEGDIEVSNRPGGGSCFRFTVNLTLDERPEQPAGDRAPTRSKDCEVCQEKDIAVMLVEDNPINRKILALSLKSLGLDPVLAENGEQAVGHYRRQSFDVIFMDCQMPVMDGYEATRQIRLLERDESSRYTPIIATTANSMRGDREKCTAAGMDDFLAKPYHQDDLVEILQKWLSVTAAS